VILGDRVLVQSILSKNAKYFSLEMYNHFNDENKDRDGFIKFNNLYSYEEHEKMIDYGEIITKSIYEKKDVNWVEGIVVGRRTIATKRKFKYFTETHIEGCSYDEHIETTPILENIYLVAISMKQIVKVREKYVEVIK